ncbi:hypothetical protein ZHAS_00005824 [Anopheles sinensis]|uniref:Uncharacterized protein n=1 Tax=Anopheles sinensis TaxID=74873 RepID=A0A084VKQ3_ANOSI|nr:hypothetical protein ZHAS_00005824 [Anopheles sinensis]
MAPSVRGALGMAWRRFRGRWWGKEKRVIKCAKGWAHKLLRFAPLVAPKARRPDPDIPSRITHLRAKLRTNTYTIGRNGSSGKGGGCVCVVGAAGLAPVLAGLLARLQKRFSARLPCRRLWPMGRAGFSCCFPLEVGRHSEGVVEVECAAGARALASRLNYGASFRAVHSLLHAGQRGRTSFPVRSVRSVRYRPCIGVPGLQFCSCAPNGYHAFFDSPARAPHRGTTINGYHLARASIVRKWLASSSSSSSQLNSVHRHQLTPGCIGDLIVRHTDTTDALRHPSNRHGTEMRWPYAVQGSFPIGTDPIHPTLRGSVGEKCYGSGFGGQNERKKKNETGKWKANAAQEMSLQNFSSYELYDQSIFAMRMAYDTLTVWSKND